MSADGVLDAAGRLRRTWTVAALETRDLVRDPLLLALLVVLPAYFVGAWGAIVPDAELPVSVATADGTATLTVGMAELISATIAPVAGALVVGITALFAVQRSRDVDRRLGIVGYRPTERLAGRSAVLAVVGVVVTTIAVAVARLHLIPEHPLWFAGAVLLAAGAYGAVGALLGRVLDRMAGVYVMLFAPTLDVMILQNPMADAPAWAAWLPGHHATKLATSAAFADGVALDHAALAAATVAVLFGALAVVTTLASE